MKRLLLFAVYLTFFGLLYGQGTPISVGTQTNTFTSMIRGYHFTAPTSFTICGLYIPPDASATGTQTILVVRFTAGPPPAFAATTNNFIQLFTISNAPATQVIACNIPVAAGEIIGVYGARGPNCVNSYGPANFVTSITDSIPRFKEAVCSRVRLERVRQWLTFGQKSITTLGVFPCILTVVQRLP